MPSSSIGRERMSLGLGWLGRWSLPAAADDDAVRPDFDDHHVRTRLDRLTLADGVDHLAVDFDGAAGKHLRAGDAAIRNRTSRYDI